MTPRPLRMLRNLNRGREIAGVLLNHGFGDVANRLGVRRWMFWRRKEGPSLTLAVRLRMAAEALGPTFVKFGQIVSTRPDLVPVEVTRELSKLREHVPPFPGRQAVSVVEHALSRPIGKVFAEFDQTPIAAGSLGQVHRARLHDGTHLAVKIRRPGIVQQVERDLSLMDELARLIERRIPESRIFDPSGLVHQFARTIRRELNFLREGRTMDEFARLFRDEPDLAIPGVYLDRSAESVLTMEYIAGIHLDDTAGIDAVGVFRSDLAAFGSRIFMRMAFEHGLFHGDPHPGNVRVLPRGGICLYDFGMIGMLDEPLREKVVDLFAAVSHRDVRATCRLLLDLGEPFGPIDEGHLAADVRDFVGAYYGMALDQIDIGAMMEDFLQTMAQHRLRCPTDLVMLFRAVVSLEGSGRQLDPHFNLAEHLAPFVEELIRRRYDPLAIADRAALRAVRLVQTFERLPERVDAVLDKLERDDMIVQINMSNVDRLATEVDQSSNRLAIGMVMSALVVASAMLISSSANSHWFAVPIFVLSSLLGLWLIYGIVRSGNL